jgi:hypothetical protein
MPVVDIPQKFVFEVIFSLIAASGTGQGCCRATHGCA